MTLKKWSHRMLMALTLTVFIVSSAIAAEKPMGYGTGNPGSITHSVGSAVAKLFSDQGMQTLLQPHGGPNAFVPAVNAAELDFAGVNELELRYAVTGTEYFKGQPMPDLRVVSVLLPLRTAIFVKKDSPYKSVKDLKGKRFSSDYSAQQIVNLIATGILANAGLTWNDIKRVPVPNVNRGADDFMAGKVDAFFFDVVSGKVQEAAAAVGGLRALPIDPAPEAMARFREHMPVAYAYLMQPNPAVPSIVEPTYISAFDLVLVTNTKVPDDVIYKATKALYNGKQALIATFKPMGEIFDQKKMAKVLVNGEYHPGAVKFYKEVGLWPPKEGATK
jgi:uncharacterized protein